MLKRLCYLIIPLLLLSVSSCKEQKCLEVECYNVYDHKIGLNQKIIMDSYAPKLSEENLDLIEKAKKENITPTVIAINDSKELLDIFVCETPNTYDLGITCVKKFSGSINIDSLTYSLCDQKIRVATRIHFTYNENFEYNPSFSTSYQSFADRGQAGSMHRTTCGIYPINGNDFYFDFPAWQLNYTKLDSVIIKNIYLVDNVYCKLTNVSVAYRSSAYLFPNVLADMKPFEEFHGPLETILKERPFGVVLKYRIESTTNEDLYVIGVDMVFEVTVNGDDHTIFVPILFEVGWLYQL
ncbi:MAG: hypothetical protein NC310_00630 [Roseburia sp.]|nr:hypothetical protein [Anaeroplasma bactoclasticum]MCM1195557.1 hypothetical protein [Roseburia sp.]MCM1555972.1 hypothetical protein [Anaeroplasma bactoclasticum]